MLCVYIYIYREREIEIEIERERERKVRPGRLEVSGGAFPARRGREPGHPRDGALHEVL